jgi:predicted cupin superfamily sugar epimerase
MSADDIIKTLGLKPHPEGGHYAETFRAEAPKGERGAGTAIYFLLKQGERSHWHRVDAVEIWHWHAGAPLTLAIEKESFVLGPDLAAGQRPQIVVPAHHWQAAQSLGEWTLAGCTVSPSFEFSGFEMAPPGWKPDTP